jgi:outer membrane lipoprotein-sorting protein
MRLTVLALVSLVVPHVSGAPELTAENVLEKMAETYRGCRSYRDSGLARTVFFSDRGKRTVEKPFTTAFVRPDRFRFEYLDRRGDEEFDRYLVWRSGPDVRTWWDVTPGVETQASLDHALGGAAGVSDLASRRIPELLMPAELGPWWLPGLVDLQRIEDADVEDVRCYRIRGTLERGERAEQVTLWIDRECWLLRRVEEQRRFDDFRTERTTDYAPEIDVEIDASLLVFDPPTETTDTASRAPDDAAATGTVPEIEAGELLRAMAETYAACESYRDSGTVTTVFFTDRGKRTVRRPFTTAFVRPDRFRYEFRDRAGEDELHRYLVWRDGDDVRTWWDVRPGVQQPGSLVYALAGATGVSGGSAHMVPSLLSPDEMTPALVSGLRDLQVLEDAWLGSARCHRVSGSLPGGRPATMRLWIDAESRLLRRIEQDAEPGDFRTEQTTDYAPEIDVPIDSSALAFDPPEEAR